MITIMSPAFAEKQWIPAQYTCDGKDINPPLALSGIPARAKSVVIIVDDPDSPHGVFTHWLMWNVLPTVAEIAEDSIPQGAMLGRNDFGKTAWGGPCPASGIHRYVFHVYALDTILSLPAGSGREQVEAAMHDHILDQGELMGQYERVFEHPS